MNFDEIEKIISEEANVSICPICGTPFTPYHSRQMTCGTEECRRLWKNKYLSDRRKRLIAEDKEAFNRSHAEAQRKTRHKKRMKEMAERNYARIQTHWERVAEFDRTVSDHGITYGERQMEKTLATVQKIDVEGFMKERQKK